MKKKSLFDVKAKPYNLLGFAAIFMALIPFLPKKQSALDINLHDTYIVVAHVSIYRTFACLLLFLWSVYVIANRLTFSKILTWLHVIITLLSIIFIMATINRTWGMDGIPRRYYAFDEFEKQRSFSSTEDAYAGVLLFFVIAQLIFIINLTIGTVKYFSSPKVSTNG